MVIVIKCKSRGVIEPIRSINIAEHSEVSKSAEHGCSAMQAPSTAVVYFIFIYAIPLISRTNGNRARRGMSGDLMSTVT